MAVTGHFRFSSVGCCCSNCFDPLFIICIYDESSSVYTSCSGTYQTDKEAFETYVDDTGSTIRLGIIIPSTSVNRIKCASKDLPYDTDRSEVSTSVIGFKSPRVEEQDILDMFETLRTDPTTEEPELLLFALDNSGSIRVSQYLSELNAAKATLEALYPNLIILDDISNSGERWARDAKTGSEGQVCP